MKKILLSFMFLISTSSISQSNNQNYTVYCDKPEKIISVLLNNYGELPLVSGKVGDDEKNSVMVMTVNPKTNDWTIVLLNTEKACVLTLGKEFSIQRYN